MAWLRPGGVLHIRPPLEALDRRRLHRLVKPCPSLPSPSLDGAWR